MNRQLIVTLAWLSLLPSAYVSIAAVIGAPMGLLQDPPISWMAVMVLVITSPWLIGASLWREKKGKKFGYEFLCAALCLFWLLALIAWYNPWAARA